MSKLVKYLSLAALACGFVMAAAHAGTESANPVSADITRKSLSAVPLRIIAREDADPLVKHELASKLVSVSDINVETPAKGRFYNLSIKPGGIGYPGATVNFDKPVDFSKYEVLKLWLQVNYPTSYMELIINGADKATQSFELLPDGYVGRGTFRMNPGKWYAVYVPYKADHGWVRFGEKMNHAAVNGITLLTCASYLRESVPVYNYSFGGMELLTKQEADAEFLAEKMREAPVSGARLPSPDGVAVWTSDPCEKIYSQTSLPAPENIRKSLCAEGAGGEYVPLICSLRPDKDLDITSISASALVSKQGSIPSASLVVRYIDYVNGMFESIPDPLPLAEGKRIHAPADSNTTIWVTCAIPEGTKAGEYSGSLNIGFSNGTHIEVPAALEVYGFNLSRKTHLKTLYSIHHFFGGPLYNFDGVKYFVDRAKRYWGRELPKFSPEYRECVENILRDYGTHRITPSDLSHEQYRYLSQASRNKLIDEYHFDPPFVVYNVAGNRYRPAAPVTPEKLEKINDSLKKWADVLKANGYADRACIKISDEPRTEDQIKWTILAAEQVKKTIPEIQSFYAGNTSRILDGLVGKINTYCMLWNFFDFTGKQAKERLAAGDKLWAYAAEYQKNCAYDPLVLRTNYWLYWKWGISGVHYSHDAHSAFLTYPNDTYPHSDGLKQIPSVRFEMIRLGMQDYEYLWMLDDLVRRTGCTDKSITGLLTVPDTIARNEWESTADPKKLSDYRRQIAKAIETLSKTSPAAVK